MDLRPRVATSFRHAPAAQRTCRISAEPLRPRLQHHQAHAAPKAPTTAPAREREPKEGASSVEPSQQGPGGAAASAASPPAIDSLRSLRVVDLQGQLRDLGLNKSGLKEVLVQRLHDALQERRGQPPVSAGVKDSPAAPAAEEEGLRGRKTASAKQSIGDSGQGDVQQKGDTQYQRRGSTTTSGRPPATQVGATTPKPSSSGTRAVRDIPMRGGDKPAIGGSSTTSGPPPATQLGATTPKPSSSGTRAVRDIPMRGGDEPVIGGNSRSNSNSSSSSSSRSGPAVAAPDGGSKTDGRQKLLISSLISKGQPRAADQPQSRREPAAPAQAKRSSSRQPTPGLTPEAAAAALERRTGRFHPVSGHPQLRRQLSWSGHRPCRYWSVGKAKDVVFPESVRTLVSAPPSDVYPIVVGDRGQYLEDCATPLSQWVDHQPLPQDLPPFPPSVRKESYGSHELKMVWADKEEATVGNSSGLSLSFLGTSSDQSTRHRAQPSVALNRAKDVLLIDAGDDTQRQIAQMSTVRIHKIYRIFITCLSADCILGLPGLLCSISSSRERGHEIADIPVHMYGPPGLTDFLDTMLKVSNTYIEVSIVVHEFTMKAVPPEQAAPICVNERSRLWMVLMPPDQLNPQGFIDGDLTSFMPNQGRATIPKGSSFGGGVLGYDPRANFLPFANPVPGLPTRKDVAPLDMRWTIRMDCEGIMTALPLTASRPTMAYVFLEADRVGNLMVERADALGVPKGSVYGMLKEGKSVVIPGGRLVTPEMVISPPRMGRKVVFMGTCSDSSALLRHPEARSPDVLVAGCIRPANEAALPEVTARLMDPSSRVRDLLTAEALGRTAAQLGARHVLLSRFNWRLHGGEVHPYDDPVLQQLVEQVASKLSVRQRVTAVHDQWVHILEKHEGVCFPDAPLVQEEDAKDGMVGW